LQEDTISSGPKYILKECQFPEEWVNSEGEKEPYVVGALS
jgi:hypothetical protein